MKLLIKRVVGRLRLSDDENVDGEKVESEEKLRWLGKCTAHLHVMNFLKRKVVNTAEDEMVVMAEWPISRL